MDEVGEVMGGGESDQVGVVGVDGRLLKDVLYHQWPSFTGGMIRIVE